MYEWAGKSLNTSQLMLRVDLLGRGSGNYGYVLIANNRTALSAVSDVWMDYYGTLCYVE
jgi:hypothetical protein